MDRALIDEYKSRFRLVDDDAKPLSGGYGQYTRLAVVVMRPEHGAERTFTLFAESTKLVQAIGRAVGDPDWITNGFTQKWMHIEEVLRRPSDNQADDINGALQLITDDNLWLALDEYLRGSGVMGRFAKSIKAESYGLPREQQAGIGLPSNVNPDNTRLIVPKKKGE